MSFPDSEVIAAGESRLEFLDADEHHDLCPQHPWNNVCDDADPCECPALRAADAAEQGDFKNDVERGA